MSVAFAGDVFIGHDLVATKRLKMWAERGLIHIEDIVTNGYDSISVRTCLRRMNALQDMLNNTSDREKYSEDRFDQKTRNEIQTMLEGMLAVCNKAKEQGMPSDASARRDNVRRRAKTVIVPGNFPPMSGRHGCR